MAYLPAPEILQKIADVLRGIAHEDLTHAEKNIVRLLVQYGYLAEEQA